MVREERQEGTGSLWEGGEEGVASRISKVAGEMKTLPTVGNEADN